MPQATKVVTKIEKVIPEVPPSLLVCPGQPQPPAQPRQEDVALYLIDLAQAGETCRQRLVEVHQLLKKFRESDHAPEP